MSMLNNARLYLKEVLQGYGWYEGRKVSAREWIEALRSEDEQPFPIAPFPLAVVFMEEFGGLHIVHPLSDGDQQTLRKIVFDPVRAGSGMGDIVQRYGELLEKPVYPIGELSAHPLFLTEDGEVYFDAAGDGKLVGRTVAEALAVMLFRETPMVTVFARRMKPL